MHPLGYGDVKGPELGPWSVVHDGMGYTQLRL